MSKFKHTAETAALAVRSLLDSDIPKTWEEKFNGEHHSNAYEASLLVCEQLHGARWREGHPNAFKEVSGAVAAAMPELFAEYWEVLR